MKKLFVLAIALMSLIPVARTAVAAPTVSASPPAQTRRLAFKGTFQSAELYTVGITSMSVSASGSGNATEIGQFTIRYQSKMNFLDLSEIETVQFTGSNGDGLQVRGIGQAKEDRTPGMFDIVQIYTITGGTGRFAGASGTLTLNRLVSFTTGATSSTFEGYLLVP